MSLKEAFTPRRTCGPEFLRILILVAAAIAIMYPFLTGNMIGGVDARWYAYMLGDYIEQARLGHVMIPVGQGHFAWNGSVHLFRSAPVYMAVARVCDVLTLGHLNPFALQHLTVVTSAVAGTLGFYAAAVRLIPTRRWAAAGMALLYLTTPSWLETVLCAEAYMSYMAFAALPLVLYGNARTVLHSDGRGYVVLGAGLALVWMCHPPIAFNTTMATLVIQSGLIMGRGVLSWRNLMAGAAAFLVLSAYYFASMSEIPAQAHSEPRSSEVLQIVGFALFFIGIGRSALVQRPWGWAACGLAGAGIAGYFSRPWLCWEVGTAALWFVVVLCCRRSGSADFTRHAFVLLFLCTLGGAAVAEAWVGREGLFIATVNTLAYNTANIGEMFRPLGHPMRVFQNSQPGWGLVLAFALSVASLLGSRPLGAKLFFAAVLGLVVTFVRVPMVSNFLVGRFPIDFGAMCGVPLYLRITPVIVSFTAMAGVIWLATSRWDSAAGRSVTGLLLGALVVWSGLQTRPFVRHTYDVTGNFAATEKNLRTENAVLDAYAYLLLPIPSYFSHGKTDPMLESRLLDGAGKVIAGPMQNAAVMESAEFRKIRLTCQPLPNSETWIGVVPKVTVNPGEHLLLRFEFDSSKAYNGYFIMESEHAYREYHLPLSGLRTGFGAGGDCTSVLSLWNSGSTPEHYKMSLSPEPGNDLTRVGGHFGNLYVSHLDPSKLPINLKSLIPYRATVTSAAGGTLETIRVNLPGYRATVDGTDVPVTTSREHLASFPVPPGSHEVELRFVGTARLWTAAVVSGLGWIGFVSVCAWTLVTGRRQGGIRTPAFPW